MILILTAALVCNPPAEQGDTGNVPAGNTPQIFTVMSEEDPAPVRALYNVLGLEVSFIMPQWAFDPDETGEWTHHQRTVDWLDSRCDVDFDGYIALDWEFGVTEALREGPEHPRFDDIIAAHLELLQAVQYMRPHAKFGYYRMPLRPLVGKEERWREVSRATKPVMDAADVIFPSVYRHNDTDWALEYRTLKRLVEISLEFAEEKPVILYMWHRFHPVYEYGFQMIPEAIFIEHVSQLLAIEVDGRRPLGVVAWGATRWYYNRSSERDEDLQYVHRGERWDRVRAAFAREMMRGETIDEYIMRLHPTIYLQLADAVVADPGDPTHNDD